MFFIRNMIIEITSIGFKRCDSSLSFTKFDKLVFVVLLTVFWSINNGNSLDHQDHNGKQHSYSGKFAGEEKAEAIADEVNVRLAKIPSNFSTKTNCIYADQQTLSLPVKSLLQRTQRIADEIVISWVPHANVINTTEKSFKTNINNSSGSSNIRIVSDKPQNDFYNFNWIFELLACMMLASAFEICLLILRNLRNISFAFFGFWSALNLSLQNLCISCSAKSSSHKSDQQRNRNVSVGEKRTLSYMFAILTWRASQTTKRSAIITEENLRDECSQMPISYAHVTSMGDLLLLILFTHVYYQRQRFYKDVDNDNLLKDDKDNDQRSAACQKFYDVKQNNNVNSNALKDQTVPAHRRTAKKNCSHFCGNMYQQISSSLQERKSSQSKFTTLTTCTTKLPYCIGFAWYTCSFCQYSYRSCYCCCTNYRCWSHRCYIYIPLCNIIYCCCFYKNFKYFYSVNYQHCCYLCCWQDVCHINNLSSHATYHSCHCHFYCCFCNISTTKSPIRAINIMLLSKANKFPLSNDYYVWKLIWTCQNYTTLHQICGQTYSLVYVTDAKSISLYKRNYNQSAVDALNYLLPQCLLTIKNCQILLKWKKLHVTVVFMALIVICASSGGAAMYSHHHYYSSLLNRCNKDFSKCRQNKRRRKRRRRRHQHCKAYRPQHYFYTTLIQCVKRQKAKKIPKNFFNKLHKKSSKVITSTTPNYEHSLAAAIPMSPKTPMVRAIKRVRSSKPNIVWLLIGLIWFEGPKIVNCNVIINYQNQQQPEQQQQQQTGNAHKETTTNSINSNFEYKIENFNQMKTKNSNNNSNSNKNKNKNNNNSSTSNNNKSPATSNNSSSSNSNNIKLSVNVIPIINTIHWKHYCNSNYHQNLIRSSQRVERALKPNSNMDTSTTSSASLNYINLNDDLNSEQMPSSAFQAMNEESHIQSDLMRLESIKHQILFKLGLTRKPNVSHPLPKQFIWDTIYRADGIKSFHEFSNTNNFQDHQRFTPQQNYPYWPRTSYKSSTVVPVNIYRQRQQRQEDRSLDKNYSVDSADNIKRSLGSIVIRKKYAKNRQLQQEQQKHFKHYKNDIIYRKSATATSTTKNLNELIYTTTKRNKLIKYTNKTVNNFTILKQSQHQPFNKNSPHSTTSTTITSANKPITHQQNNNQHTNNNNISDNSNNNSNNNNSNNNKNDNNNHNVNNSNNKNSNNNIIMVQKHLRNNNKYIEEEKQFTYLTDINSSDDSLNIVEEYKSPDTDENNSILKKKNYHQHHHHKHDPTNVQPLQLQQNHDKTTEYYQLSIDDIVDADANINVESKVIHDVEVDPDNDEDDDNEGGLYRRHNEHEYRHDNYFSKLDTFDEHEDFFGNTQEIITFAEKGKMYKNHRLVEFSHQNNEKAKQMLHVRYAEIHIRIDRIAFKNKSRAGSGIKRKRLKIWIFQLIENNYTYKGFDHVAQFCASFEVDTSSLGWKKFDITKTVKEWYSRREREKLRLLIDCTGCGKMYSVHLFKRAYTIRERRVAEERRNTNVKDINSKDFYNVTNTNGVFTELQYNQTFLVTKRDNNDRGNHINVESKDDEDLLNSSRPFLVLHTEARRQRRVRRRAINCNGALHGQCCKESFYVSFKALGWDDWIIAPRGYFANYCRGDCTGPYRTPDTFQTFHAHFIEEYRKMGLLNGMQPCCAPIKFSSMSLIYYGDEGIIKRDLPKMVVDECGCP